MRLDELTAKESEALFNLIQPMEMNIGKMTVGDVCRCILSEKSFTEYIEEKYDNIYDKVAFAKGFVRSANALFSTFEKYNNQVPAEYAAILSNTKQLCMAESILVDCVKYFNLHSVEEAEKLTFDNWFLLKKDEVISQYIDRKYQDAMIAKQKREVKR